MRPLFADKAVAAVGHLASENYDAAYISMIYSNFLLVLHCYSTSITSSIKQCVNDKN